MNIITSTKSYEHWLGIQTTIDEADLKSKHANMCESAFTFLRATFYRWAQLWPKRCKEIANGPMVLAVGDLHVENFGTWRDAEGRLVWGVNDFDETCYMAYANDLVRLAVSASLAIKDSHLKLSIDDACKSILKGYSAGLNSGGKPFVLSEEHAWLREAAVSSLRDPVAFWKKLDSFVTTKDPVPDAAFEALRHGMPSRDMQFRVVHRTAGEGSLGRLRFVGIAEWHSGQIAREVKSLVPSAYLWANESKGPFEVHYTTVLSKAVRCPDPFLSTWGQWIVRRLAADCSRIEVAQLAPIHDELQLMNSMGFEAANIHLGSEGAPKAIQKHLAKLPKNWLMQAVETMEDAVVSDWKSWRKAASEST